MTLYDQEKKRLEYEKLRKSLKKHSKKHNSSLERREAQEAYGTDGGYTSGEEITAGNATLSALNNTAGRSTMEQSRMNHSALSKHADTSKIKMLELAE